MFIETHEGRRWSYSDLETITADLSIRLRAMGLKNGDRIVAQLERSPWNIFLYFASLRSGLVWVPLNPHASSAELRPIIAEVEPSLMVGSPRVMNVLHRLAIGMHTRVLTVDENDGGDLMKLPPGGADPDASVMATDPAAILFTSGTTGQPKGAVMPHDHLVRKARNLGKALGWHQSDKLLHVMPLNHAHGLFMTTHCVAEAGASMILMPRFDAESLVACLPLATVVSGVPTMYTRMLSCPALAEKAREIRLFVSASAPLPVDVLLKFRELTGHTIVESWGTTETLTLTAQPLFGERRIGSVGQPLPEVEVRVVDEGGKTLPVGEVGRLEVRGPTRFLGYWGRSVAGQAHFHKDGYVGTGDLGFIDAEGYVTLVGRTSDVIITGGYKVYPMEIEHALEQHAQISKAAVFGLLHPDYGEAVAAAIEVVPGHAIDISEVLGELRRSLTSYKVPKALFVVDTLPLTELGKIQRNAVAKPFQAHFQAGTP